LNSQILQKRQFHYDVAKVPVFKDQYALHIAGCRRDGTTQPIHYPHDWAQNAFNCPNQEAFSATYPHKNAQRCDVGNLPSGVRRRRGWFNLNQNDPFPTIG
jgi:hypothetical protein